MSFWFNFVIFIFRFLLTNKIIKEDSEFPYSVKRYHLMRYVKAEEKIVTAVRTLEEKSVDLSDLTDFERYQSH